MATNLGFIDTENNDALILATDLGQLKGTNTGGGIISALPDNASSDNIDFYQFELTKTALINSYIELSSPDVVAIQGYYQMRLYQFDETTQQYKEMQVSTQSDNYPYSYRLELSGLKAGSYVFGVAGAERDFANATGLYNLRIALPSIDLPGAVKQGTNGDDVLTGVNSENTLYGEDGNDSLTGSSEDDTLYGGNGNDTLAGGESSDVLNGGAGVDKIVVSGDLNKFVLTNNRLIGQGVDVLLSIERAELVGGDSENYIDAAQFTNGAVYLDGGLDDDTLLGGSKNDSLVGGSGFDYLDGGEGKDTLVGGSGGDTYIVDDLGDKVIEAGTSDYDLVKSSVSFSLSATLEDLILTGKAAINGVGNDLANHLTGNSARNQLQGLGGYDVLDGGKGVDTLIGGKGDDTYTVDSPFDKVIEEANGGSDLVQSSASKYSLSAYVEDLTLIGLGFQGTGNELDNTLEGNGLDNVLSGGDGDDIIYGMEGGDTLYGGNGDDLLYGDSSGYANDDVIFGGNGNDHIDGGLYGHDILNGGAGYDFFASDIDDNDVFVFQFGQSLLAKPDEVDDFGVGSDKVDLLVLNGAELTKPVSLTRANDIEAFGLSKANIAHIFTDANGGQAGNQALQANSAALVQTYGGISYLIVNDGQAGFQADSDLVIALGIYTELPPLGAIAVDTFFV